MSEWLSKGVRAQPFSQHGAIAGVLRAHDRVELVDYFIDLVDCFVNCVGGLPLRLVPALIRGISPRVSKGSVSIV